MRSPYLRKANYSNDPKWDEVREWYKAHGMFAVAADLTELMRVYTPEELLVKLRAHERDRTNDRPNRLRD
jgi:hypothetical protein